MYKEIGSEFWESNTMEDITLTISKTHEYLLTGRTALDFIIKDIKVLNKLKTVYMPSYCCHSMIQPFVDNDVRVEFYNIGFANNRYSYDIDYQKQCDAVLFMQYFGFYNKDLGQAINRLQESGRIIMEDATHSWFSATPYEISSDYVFTSLRKWTGLSCGAIAIKQNGRFSLQPAKRVNLEYIALRQQAATLKKKYIDKDLGNKNMFLKLFSEAEQQLETDYQDYYIPDNIKNVITRLDRNHIQQRRRLNAQYLIDRLRHFMNISTIELAATDVPLFVPILVHDGKRNELQKFLVDNQVYCPVHWPIADVHINVDKELYDNSLSIICDQRYSQLEMKKIIDLFYTFYGGKV